MVLFSSTKKIPHEEALSHTPAQVQLLPDTARPSVRHDSLSPSAGAAQDEYTHPATDAHGHGIWVCCCGHDNTLVHRAGAHPFCKLACGKCAHILCQHCLTSAIVTPLSDARRAAMAALELPKLRGIVETLFQVCPHCGLSFQAQMCAPDHSGERLVWAPIVSHSHSELCACGAAAKAEWLKFVVGDAMAYCLHPAWALHALKNTRVEEGLQMGRLEPAGSVREVPEMKAEGAGCRRARGSETVLGHSDSLAQFKARPFNNTHPDGRSQQEVEQSYPIDLSVQNASSVRQPLRRRPERLGLVQHHGLKRSGAVRGGRTPRSGALDTPRSGAINTSRSAAINTSRSGAINTSRSAAINTSRSAAINTPRSAVTRYPRAEAHAEAPILSPSAHCSPPRRWMRSSGCVRSS
ncbi:uncharacterized protein M421DRAFT_132042 [Didymella exigua CBS 183.55]|uniref:Probable double zinc ribbon domain-containing protein n=1 Tax=Didymella exigua CBS 183.55 TaxID=1150837 RepID=A0A6A5RQ20_9PLEO|nr:uncharacterized protein M421DRAFT_132042 [Didymella exigua CBS 183.55]KAF1929882.1 hypothetical protein M421DRAFT_132042 [Didymella exigua CBS 183.55]